MNYKLRDELLQTIRTAVAENDKDTLFGLLDKSRGATPVKKIYKNFIRLMFTSNHCFLNTVLESILRKMFSVFRDSVQVVFNTTLLVDINDYLLLNDILKKESPDKNERMTAASLLGKLTYFSLSGALFDESQYKYYFRKQLETESGKDLKDELAVAYSCLIDSQRPSLKEVLDELNIDNKQGLASASDFEPRLLQDLLEKRR